MRLSLARKITILIALGAGLSIVTSVIGLMTAHRISRILQQSTENEVPSLTAAKQLDTALRDQNTEVRSYVFDNANAEWLQRLETARRNFRSRLEQTWTTANTDLERELLTNFESRYQEFDRTCDEIIALCRKGDRAAAKKVALRGLPKLYHAADAWCDQFIQANRKLVDDSTAAAQGEARIASWFLILSAGLALGSAGLLAAFFFHDILSPLRQLVAESQRYRRDGAAAETKPVDNEFRAVQAYLHVLMNDVAGSRALAERNQQQLAQAEKLASVGRLAASVAHEIRNPLNSIRLWLYAIEKSAAPEGQLAADLGNIAAEVQRLERIVQQFLEFARPPRLKLRMAQLGPVLAKIAELARHRAEAGGVDLQYHDHVKLPSIRCDPEQLQQVVLNLVNNGLDATPRGGKLQLRASNGEGEAAGDPGELVIRVCDSGSGISDEVQDRIFEPFFSTKASGSGLGLCISAQIVAAHGGRLILESTSSSGTTFAIVLPVLTATEGTSMLDPTEVAT